MPPGLLSLYTVSPENSGAFLRQLVLFDPFLPVCLLFPFRIQKHIYFFFFFVQISLLELVNEFICLLHKIWKYIYSEINNFQSLTAFTDTEKTVSLGLVSPSLLLEAYEVW